jgi:hypothetical protein
MQMLLDHLVLVCDAAEWNGELYYSRWTNELFNCRVCAGSLDLLESLDLLGRLCLRGVSQDDANAL